MDIALHSYFNSSTSFRVRIALALKGITFDCLPVNLRAGEQRAQSFLALNPSGGVPVLTDNGFTLTQSLAILDYLDRRFPRPRLIPEDARQAARVLELANLIACDIHPINNLRVLKYLKRELAATEAQTQAWYQHWVHEGLGAAEALLRAGDGGPFCFGDQPSVADCCLIPQVANALRMHCPLEGFPGVRAVYEHCMGLPAFQAAAPSGQPDYS